MSLQDNEFINSEGDAYYQRNKAKLLPDLIDALSDPILEMMDNYCIWPDKDATVLEVGCANGFRLEHIRQKTGARCYGIDASADAISDGRYHWRDLHLNRDVAHNLCYDPACFSLVVVNYVLHWCDRSTLLKSIAEIDRVLADGGYLILGDFAPDHPTKTPYQHKEGIWTYKLPGSYADIFTASGCYSEVARLTHNHKTHRVSADVESDNRGATILLRKGEVYTVG